MERLPYSWICRTGAVKMTTLPKAIYRFNTIPIKIPTTRSTGIERTILKFIWSYKRLQVEKIILSKKNNAEAITRPTELQS